MRTSMKKIVVYINFWRLIIPTLIYMFDKKINNLIKEDLKNLSYMLPNTGTLFKLWYALVYSLPFRGVFFYRIREYKLLKTIHNALLPNKREIEISGDIAGGLTVFHGQACVIHCTSAGNNLCVWQNVTVGRNPRNGASIDKPIIGNNVNIYTGAIVIGGITIGDNVDIGAASLVLNDIPSNCVVEGIPAKIIKHKR